MWEPLQTATAGAAVMCQKRFLWVPQNPSAEKRQLMVLEPQGAGGGSGAAPSRRRAPLALAGAN